MRLCVCVSEIEILSSFGTDSKPLSAAEIIERSGLPRSSVFRSLKSLVASSFVYQDALSKRYVLGPRVLQLGLVARRQLSSEEFIAEPLLELLRKTGETITFSVADVPWRICTYVLEAPSDLRHVAQVGARYPLHLGAAGKVIMAFLPMGIVAGILKVQGFPKSQTTRFEHELDAIRRDGYASTTGERVPGTSSVAAPIFIGDLIFGSVAIAGPTDRMFDVLEKYRPFVIATARAISERLSRGERSKQRTAKMPTRYPGGASIKHPIENRH